MSRGHTCMAICIVPGMPATVAGEIRMYGETEGNGMITAIIMDGETGKSMEEEMVMGMAGGEINAAEQVK